MFQYVNPVCIKFPKYQLVGPAEIRRGSGSLLGMTCFGGERGRIFQSEFTAQIKAPEEWKTPPGSLQYPGWVPASFRATWRSPAGRRPGRRAQPRSARAQREGGREGGGAAPARGSASARPPLGTRPELGSDFRPEAGGRGVGRVGAAGRLGASREGATEGRGAAAKEGAGAGRRAAAGTGRRAAGPRAGWRLRPRRGLRGPRAGEQGLTEQRQPAAAACQRRHGLRSPGSPGRAGPALRCRPERRAPRCRWLA